MSSGTDAAIAILSLAEEQNPPCPGAYLLGLAVGALQEDGMTLEEIQRCVAKAFNTSWEEAAAAARALERPQSDPS